MDCCIICEESLGSEKSTLYDVSESEARKLASKAYKLGDSSLRRRFYGNNITLHKKCYEDFLSREQPEKETGTDERRLRSTSMI